MRAAAPSAFCGSIALKNPLHLFRSRNPLPLGFLAVLLLLAMITVIGLTRMAAINRHIAVIANEHAVKKDLIETMRGAARERTVSLHRMAIMPDPFQRDDEYLYFRKLATDFAQAANRLYQMPLTTEERSLLDTAIGLTQLAVPVQARVHELIEDGQATEANNLLLTEALPAQNRVFGHFSKFLELQQRSMRAAVESAGHEYRVALYTMTTLGLVSVVLGALIAFFVVRRVNAAERALSTEKERAEVTLGAVVDAVIATDAERRVEYMNMAAERLTGWTLDEARGRPIGDIYRVVNEETRQAISTPFIAENIEGQVVGLDSHYLLVTRAGAECAIEESASPMRNEAGEVIGYALVFRDVTRSRQMARELSWQATHDALTGLGNRIEFDQVVSQLWESAKQHGKHHVLIYLDLDRFKIVNDTCGHVAGDELLRQLAVLIGRLVREGDSLFRLGGDEFAILLNGCPLPRAESVAEDIRRAVEEFRFVWQSKSFAVGASMGLVPITMDSESISHLLAAADAACYAAKGKGRNRVQVYEPSDRELALREGEMRWLPRINHALEENRLVLYCQKIVNVTLGDLTGDTHYEVLLRMRDEGGEIVLPQAFLPAAERYNLMPEIDRWVVRHCVDWMLAHMTQLQPIPVVHINLSGQSLSDEKFLSFLIEQLSRFPSERVPVGFEITETAAIANLVSAMRLMSVLKGLGCQFSLDDFGSGMSSFAYLKSLPVDRVKIDGVFVRDMVHDPVDHAMVEAINRIGHVMGIKTVAEFVENDAILHRLREMGVDYAQGYGLHRPEPLANLFPRQVPHAIDS